MTDMIETVSGRVFEHFLCSDGSIIHGQYFTHLLYHIDWIKKFQIIQKKIDFVEIKIKIEKEVRESDLKEIKKKIKLVMNESCKVNFTIVDEILPSKSGKFLYVYSEIYSS